MEIDQFSSTALNFKGIQVGYGSLQEDVFQGKESFSEMEFLGEIDPLPIENRKRTKLFSDQNQKQLQETKVGDFMLEEVNFDPDMQLQQTQLFQETTELMQHGVASSEPVEYNKHVHPSLASLELLRNYGSRFKRLSEQNISTLSNIETSLDYQKMSTEEIIRVAGARYCYRY